MQTSGRTQLNKEPRRSTFSGAFHAGAFEVLSASTLVFILVVNILLYIAFTVALFALARLTPVKPIRLKVEKEEEELLVAKQPLFDPSTTVALLFCGAAKGIVLGGPYVFAFPFLYRILRVSAGSSRFSTEDSLPSKPQLSPSPSSSTKDRRSS